MHGESPETSSLDRMRSALRAFRSRNYRLFFTGQGISLIGTWMQSVATGWLVFRLTRSSFDLGLVAFAGQLPAFFLSPFAGALSDRWNRRRIILGVQMMAMLQALVLTLITLTGHVTVPHVIGLSFFLGLINAFDIPTRQAFVVELIENRDDLGNAIALNSALFNATRLIGPAVAGVLIGIWGEGVCFAVNTVSYMAAITAFLLIRTAVPRREKAPGGLWEEIRAGVLYAYRFSPIRDILLLIALISFIGMSFPVLLPVFARDVLGGGSHDYGFLIASSGVGAVLGTLYLAQRESVLGLGRVILVSMILFGLSLVAFSFSRHLAISMFFMVLIGFGMIVNIAASNTILQTVVEEEMRGRVMSLYTMAFMGTAPLGSLLAGSLSARAGAPLTVTLGGGIILLGSLLFLRRLPHLRSRIRPVYRQKGILPEMAAGLQTAEALREPPEYSGN